MARKATFHEAQIPSNCLSLVQQIVLDYPNISFKTGKKFAFEPPKTVILGPSQPYYTLQTLHELAHALCGHKDWSTGVSRLKLEREAWERARELFYQYQKLSPNPWDEEFVETSLDTYRDWLHAKTRCPSCGLTRFQTDDGVFHCPRCENFT